jgi:arsenate reductase
MKVSMTHNPACGTSRNVLAILRERGIEPTIIEYLKKPLQAGEIMALVKKMGSTSGSVVSTLRDVVRTKEPAYAELGLAHVDDDTLLEAMVLHPILLNRPIVSTEKGTKLCRPSETVGEIL